MKSTLTGILMVAATLVSAQSNQVQNASNYLRNDELDKAKAAADAASVHEATKSSAKLWMYRGQIYQKIYESKKDEVKKLDADAQEKAVESFITCLKLDKDNIYKDQVKNNIVQTSASLDYKVKYFVDIKEYAKAIAGLDLLEQALPYDFDGGLKRNNITKENLMLMHFKVYSRSGDKEKTKEFADKLIAIKFKDASIYTSMAKIYLIDKDTAKALSYIEKGKLIFEDNMELINTEINIYLAQHKTDVLKTKLTDAIAISPDNEVLHCVLGNLYVQTKDNENAEKEFQKAIEIKPDYDLANYNLGVIYFNSGNDWGEKINALPMNDTKKAKEFEEKKNELYRKAVVNFEKSYEISPDKATKQRLRQLYLKLGETEKAEKYK